MRRTNENVALTFERGEMAEDQRHRVLAEHQKLLLREVRRALEDEDRLAF